MNPGSHTLHPDESTKFLQLVAPKQKINYYEDKLFLLLLLLLYFNNVLYYYWSPSRASNVAMIHDVTRLSESVIQKLNACYIFSLKKRSFKTYALFFFFFTY